MQVRVPGCRPDQRPQIGDEIEVWDGDNIICAGTLGGFLGPPVLQVLCPMHGKVALTPEQYQQQSDDPFGEWTCPTCGGAAKFDQLALENSQEPPF